MGDDTIAVQKNVCDQKESITLHRQEKKLVVMLAADERHGLSCGCVCACVCVRVCVHMCVCICICACTVACTSIIYLIF